MDKEATAIDVHKLGKSYGRHEAIRDLTFAVQRGEIVGFLGPNGAGKSTTLRILCGLLPATRGEAFVVGIPVAHRPEEVKKKLGYMPENNPLPEHLRVIEYLEWRAALKEIPHRRRRQRVQEVMELCDLHRKTTKKLISTLSKGFRQRVGLADAILAEPEVAVLDEPTIGLDPHQVLIFRQLLDNLRGRITIILSSHILDEVERSCDRVIIINQGRLVACGTPLDLRHEYAPGCTFRLSCRFGSAVLAEAIQALGLEARIEETTGTGHDQGAWREVRLHCARETTDDAALMQALTRWNGLEIRAFHREEVSLETIFLSATRRSLDVEMKPAGSAALTAVHTS